MTGLMEPLDEAQQALLDIVWALFAEHHEFPVHAHVEYCMQERDFDAAEALASLPAIGKSLYRGGYRAIGHESGGGVPQPESRVYLTMAGLYHVRDLRAMEIIVGLLAFLRALSAARSQIRDNPFTAANTNISLKEVHEAMEIATDDLPWIAAVAEHAWLGMNVRVQILWGVLLWGDPLGFSVWAIGSVGRCRTVRRTAR